MPVDEAFWAELEQAPRAVLALDYDGTLAPFRTERDQAVPYPGVTAILNEITRDPATRLAVVSGRPSDEVLPLLDLTDPPEIWGCHGWEHRPAGGASTWHALPPGVEQKLADAFARAQAVAGTDRVERKIASVAVHWRGRPDPQQAAAAAHDVLDRYGDDTLELLPFAAGLELRCPLWDKGRALQSLLAEESPEVPAAYLGDDRTDEDAFRVLAERPNGLPVLVASEDRPTAAVVRLCPPEDLISFLRRWCDRRKGT